MSDTLQIPLKKKYFDEIVIGTKIFEYRAYNDYWAKRLIDRSYDWIVLTSGYPKKTDSYKHHRVKYRGYQVIKMEHDEFGPKPVWLFVILLTKIRL